MLWLAAVAAAFIMTGASNGPGCARTAKGGRGGHGAVAVMMGDRRRQAMACSGYAGGVREYGWRVLWDQRALPGLAGCFSEFQRWCFKAGG